MSERTKSQKAIDKYLDLPVLSSKKMQNISQKVREEQALKKKWLRKKHPKLCPAA